MLHAVFYEIMQMSMAASIVIVMILLVRLVLKRFPKIFSYLLWIILLVRLLLPFSFEMSYRSIPTQMKAESNEEMVVSDTVQAEYIEYTNTEKIRIKEPIYPYLWIGGIGIFVIYYIVSYARIRRRLVGAVPYNQDEDIYFADNIQVPFVIGAMNPKIYLPSDLMDKEIGYIILHETYHIRRKDHIVKPLALLALTIHWFNPLVWLSFYLMTRDMEMSCDEAVMKRLSEEERQDYMKSLLQLATGRRLFSGISIAFGEGDTKSRINNVVRWKKAGLLKIASATGVVICIVIIGVLIPKNKTVTHPFNWIKQAKLSQLTCEDVDETVLRDLVYVLKEIKVDEFQEYTEYVAEIELTFEENGQSIRLIYGDGVTLFSFENTISDGKLWGVEDKDLALCMKEVRNNRNENIYVKENPPQWLPVREEVYEMRERALAGVDLDDDYYLTDLVKVMNMELESIYLYEGQFADFEDPSSIRWKDIDYDKYRLYVNGVKKRMQNSLLAQDIEEMLAYLDIMEENHDVEALKSFFYKIHDLDYYLLRYDAEWYYIHDMSFVRTYYGALHIYDELRAE